MGHDYDDPPPQIRRGFWHYFNRGCERAMRYVRMAGLEPIAFAHIVAAAVNQLRRATS